MSEGKVENFVRR